MNKTHTIHTTLESHTPASRLHATCLRAGSAALMFLALSALTASPAAAQRGMPMPDSLPETNQAIFAPLELPAPNAMRDASGRPGPGYWQQAADYDIRVSLDAANHRITGSETITYTNNSPDELQFVWVQLDQNIFRTGSRGAMVDAASSRRRPTGEGLKLTRVEVKQGSNSRSAAYTEDGTRLRVDLPQPLPADGGQLELSIDWTFPILSSGGGRMGRLETEEGWIYQLAQWYPRMAVYDDVSGWNTLPYLGMGEFYLEYGSMDVEITVPREMIVVATGELQNPADVLTTAQSDRLEQARGSAETVVIVTAEEVGAAASRPSGTGPLTWRFHADDVRDFAWAASQAFVWDAASWEDVLLMSVYPKESIGPNEEGDAGWEESTQFVRHTVSFYSDRWSRYPYPVAINVAGMVGGMEYPMIVFCHWRATGRGLFGVTDHEIGHTWFPMVVGSDERRFAWMDEGFNSFLNHYSGLAYYDSEPSQRGLTGPETIAGFTESAMADQPIMTRPDVQRPMALGFLAYAKPAFGLVMLREAVLGPELFDAAFDEYIDRWSYKHPQPADFFRTMEDVSGSDLSWFWRGWFYGTGKLDQAVDSVTVEEGVTRIHLSNREEVVMPTVIEIGFVDGSSVRWDLPVEIWVQGDSFTLPLEDTPDVTSVTLDPDQAMPDVDRSNDTWPAGAPEPEQGEEVAAGAG